MPHRHRCCHAGRCATGLQADPQETERISSRQMKMVVRAIEPSSASSVGTRDLFPAMEYRARVQLRQTADDDRCRRSTVACMRVRPPSLYAILRTPPWLTTAATLRLSPANRSILPSSFSHRLSAHLSLRRPLTTMMRTSTQRVQGMRSTKAKPKPVTAMTYEELQQALQRNLAVLSNRYAFLSSQQASRELMAFHSSLFASSSSQPFRADPLATRLTQMNDKIRIRIKEIEDMAIGSMADDLQATRITDESKGVCTGRERTFLEVPNER